MSLTLFIALIAYCESSSEDASVRVMSFNVWVSGTSVRNGLRKIARHIKYVDPDVVAMQEITDEPGLNYIVDELGEPWEWIRCSRSEEWFPDVAILTKLKIVGFCSATSRAIGVPVETENGRQLFVWSAHFNYKLFGPKAAQMKTMFSLDQLIKAEYYSGRMKNAEELLGHPMVNEWQRYGLPVIVAGDLNTPSHLDWIEQTREQHFGWVVRWPVTELFQRAGFHDAYRTLHPNPASHPGHTWSPIQPYSKEWGYKNVAEPQDRLDYVFYSGPVRTINATLYCGTMPLIDISLDGKYKNNDYPSDHYALIIDLVV